MKRIAILTGAELRHTFFRKFIAFSEDIEVVKSYCEKKSLRALVEREETHELRSQHLMAREQSELDFFGAFVEHTVDRSNPVFLPQGEINSPNYAHEIIDTNPDLLVAYGCSIIKEPLLSAFEGRFLNVHLGLSPYYRGAGTNYWPLVNEEPEYVGATFMYIDPGIDTGEVIHQIRAKVAWGDTSVQIGNRLIVEMSRVYQAIIINFDHLEKMPQLPKPAAEKVYKRKDYSEDSVKRLYDNFRNGMLQKYLSEEINRCKNAPIIENPAVREL